MVDAVEVRENRHPRFLLDALDQALAAPGDDHVHVFGHAQQHADGFTVDRGHALHGVDRQARGRQPGLHAFEDDAGAVEAVRPAAQDCGIPGLQAQRSGIGGHVRAAFVDDPDDPQRHGNLPDAQAVGAVGHGQLAPHGIVELGHRRHASGHGFDPVGGEQQAVEHGLAQAFVGAGRHVDGVGGDDVFAAASDRGSGRLQRVDFLRSRGQRQAVRRRLGRLSDAVHRVL